MTVRFVPSSDPKTLDTYLGETLVHTHDVDVDVAGALPWALGFSVFGAGMVVAGVVTVQALGLSVGSLFLGGVELLLGATLLYAAWDQIASQLAKRRQKRNLDGLEAHYGLNDVTLHKHGEEVRTQPLERYKDQPLGQWVPEGLGRLLSMRALLVDEPADSPLRHAAEFAAWCTFDGVRQMRATEVFVLRVPQSGVMGWFDGTRDEDDDLKHWHERGVPIFRVRLQPPDATEADEEFPADALDRAAVIERPTRVEHVDELLP